MKILSPPFGIIQKHKRGLLWAGISGLAICATVCACFVRLHFSWDFEGLYLLKGETGRRVVLTNNVYLGEEERLLAGIDLPWFGLFTHRFHSPGGELELEWNTAEGTGVIRNRLGDGSLLVTNFSRYIDSQDQRTHGLFIGGIEPDKLHPGATSALSGSGMYRTDGSTLTHLWCNTNEGIGSSISPARFPPSTWKYLGSAVEEESAERVVLSSRHEVPIDGVPLQIERRLTVVAGQPEVGLDIRLLNGGTGTSHYFYYYGDEPWLGEFGSSKGDVGWSEQGLYNIEAAIDPTKTSLVGMVDYGNDVIGEEHRFSNIANFIGWSKTGRPDTVFFANRYEGFSHSPELQVPLRGDARSVGMYWGPRRLAAGQEQRIELRIGMATPRMIGLLPGAPAGHAAHFKPEANNGRG